MDFDLRDKEKSMRIKDLLLYFYSDEKVDLHDKRFSRAIKLDEMIKIYKSDLIDIRKLAEMQNIYSSSNKFINQFSDLEKYSDDSLVGYYAQMVNIIGDFYKKMEENEQDKAKDLIEMEQSGLFDDFYCACEFVLDYINYNDSPFLVDFLEYAGISESNFYRLVNIVCLFNGDLYDRYEKKEMENRILRKEIIMDKLNKLSNGLTTGINEDNEPFSDVDFYKYIPFYNSNSAKEILADFGVKNMPCFDRKFKYLIINVMPETSKIILDYANKNNRLGVRNFGYDPSILTEKEIYDTNISVNGITLTNEDKAIIIDYMKKNGIPFLLGAFNAVKNKYLNEGLEIKNNNNKLIKKIGGNL